jgi:hypothetical protein
LFFFFVLINTKSLDRDTSSTNHNNEEMLVSAQSRLKSDFEVIGIIGRGGFGHVFKVTTNLCNTFGNEKLTNLGTK